LSFLSSYLRVSRSEYIKGELPAVFIPALLTATSFGALLSVNVLESIAVFSLLYVTGFMINSLTDREIDLNYSTFKRGIGTAAGELGERRILGLIALQVGAGLALTIDLAGRLGNPWLVPLALGGLFFGLAYSVRPFAFKTRGLAAHAISLSISAFTVPFIFLYVAARGSIDAPGLLVISAFSVTAYSLEYANQAYDFTEDLHAGVATPAVRMGLRKSLRFAFWLCAASLPLLAFSLAYLALSRPAVTVAAGPDARFIVAMGAVAAVAAGYYLPLRGLARIARAAREADSDSEDLVATVHRECNYSLWQAAGVTGLATFGLAVFLVSASTLGGLAAAATTGSTLRGGTTADTYFDAGLPVADITGDIAAHGAPAGLPDRALVKAELFLNGERLPYATFVIPVRLPGDGALAPFAFHAVPLRLGGTTQAHLTLLVDASLTGVADTVSAHAAVAVPLP
jgi:4-hydroxybenzoate polyprenyltransferase